MRNVLGDVIYFIRFPIMDLQEYSCRVATRNVLTSDDALQILLYLSKTKSRCEAPFLSTKRKGAVHDVIFEPTKVHRGWNNSDTYVTFRERQTRVSAIYFINPTNINLEEISIGSYKTSKFAEVKWRSVGDNQLFQALFPRPIVLSSGEYAVSFASPVDPHKSYPALDYEEKLYESKDKLIFPSYSYGHFLVGFRYKTK